MRRIGESRFNGGRDREPGGADSRAQQLRAHTCMRGMEEINDTVAKLSFQDGSAPSATSTAEAALPHAVQLHMLDLAHAEDATIELNTAGLNYLSIRLPSLDASVGALKEAVCAAFAARESSSPPLQPLRLNEVRLVYLTNQTGGSACKALTDLFVDAKSLREYDVGALSWILIKRKFRPMVCPSVRCLPPGAPARADEEGEEAEEENAQEDEEEYVDDGTVEEEKTEYVAHEPYGAEELTHTATDADSTQDVG
jgi:hypothetical protein